MSRALRAHEPALAATGKALTGYLQRSKLPLYSLAFLLPAMILYEIGTSLHPADPIAFRLLQLFFTQLGATGRFIPFLAVVFVLLTWHIAQKDPWELQVDTLWGMACESWGLAIPLLALGIAVAKWNIHIPLYTAGGSLRDNIVLSLGAGIYEEFVFRLVLMTVISLIAANLLGLRKSLSNLLMVSISAVMFSLYHYLGSEAFQMRSFVFRTAAGIYFAALFLTRGFGVTAGCHIAYDIIIITLQTVSPH